ncbi:MAG: hypothetical protein KBD53_10145 [Candidatus Omnitrophica bacterium]|nr:hypothetical protein [Candidatus Omnitrophota bacterium]
MTCLNQIGKIALIGLVAIQLAACGTILYPERRNQTAGRIDVGVALMDGFWLLVGIIPGIIAFAVDFSTGAIYIPKGIASDSNESKYRIVRFDPKNTSQSELEALISQETGKKFHFSDDAYTLTRVQSEEEMIQSLQSL